MKLIFAIFVFLTSSFGLSAQSGENRIINEIWCFKHCIDEKGNVIDFSLNKNESILLPSKFVMPKQRIIDLLYYYDSLSKVDDVDRYTGKYKPPILTDSVFQIMVTERGEIKYNDNAFACYKVMISNPNQELNEHLSWYGVYIVDVGFVYFYECYNEDLTQLKIFKLIQKPSIASRKQITELTRQALKKFIHIDCFS